MRQTIVFDDPNDTSSNDEETIRRGTTAASDVRVQRGVLCTSCWQVHAATPADVCPACGHPGSSEGFPPMPYRFRGRFEFLRLLGRGAMGAVFVARDLGSDADETLDDRPVVAVKVVQRPPRNTERTSTSSGARNERFAAMFEHEVAVAPLLGRSPYFVRAFGYELGDRPWLAMEMVQWPTLRQHLSAGILSPTQTARLGIALLEAVEVMHYFRVVHRDLKPSNLFVQACAANYRVKIADLGVWTRDHDADQPSALETERRTLTGTLSYMSPEQMWFEPAGARSDLHAVGSILWKAATGDVPYPPDGEDLKAQLLARRTAVESPPNRPSGMPTPLFQVLARSLAKSRDARYDSARDMADALRRFVERYGHEGEDRRSDALCQFRSLRARVHELKSNRRTRPADELALEQLAARIDQIAEWAQGPSEPDPADVARVLAPVRSQLARWTTRITDPFRDAEDSTPPSGAPTPPLAETIVGGTDLQAADLQAKYDVEQLLGCGSLGRVYRARHRSLGHAVALKLVNRTPGPGLGAEQLRALFRAQARAASRLSHPAVVTVLDAGATGDGGDYSAMPLLDAPSLYDRLKSGAQLLPRDVREIFRPIAGALVEAHGEDLVHSNLKPARILLTSVPGLGMLPRVTGFGLHVSELERLLPNGLLFGTPRYLAPELAYGQHPTPGTDLYALGVMIYESVVGQPPFTARTVRGLMAKKLAEPAPMLVLPDTSDYGASLATLVAGLLERAPARRIGSAAEVVDRLGEFR